MEAYDCFATSSFDCCVYIWDMKKENVKLGSLMLGFDCNWQLASRLKPNERKRKKKKFQEVLEYLELIEKVTPKEFYKKFNFDDSKHLTEDNPILSKQVRKKIDNCKTKSEKILMKANALRQLHKERQRFGDDFLGDN